MAIEIDEDLVLLEPTPVKHVPANVSINHLQLRNLILSPDETDSPTLYTTHKRCILQHKISVPESDGQELLDSQDAQATPGPTVTVTEIARLPFEPVCIAFARVPSSLPAYQYTLLAAGGQTAELHLSLHSADFEQRLWEYHIHIKKASINNSVLVLPPSSQPRGFASKSTTKPLTMRVLVSNNDRTVKFFEVDISRLGEGVPGIGLDSGKRDDSREMARSVSRPPRSARHRSTDAPPGFSPYSSHDRHDAFSSNADLGELVRKCSDIKLDSAVNFTSATRDMSTLLSITDSRTIYIHDISTPRPTLLKTLSLPSIPASPPQSMSTANLTSVPDEYRDLMSMHPFLVETGPHASFAAHWSADGTKFGVASQSGLVGIWDVRSDKPIWSYQTSFRLDNGSTNGGITSGNEYASSSSARSPTSLTSSFIDSYLSMDFPFGEREVNLNSTSLLSRLFDQWRSGNPYTGGRMKHAPPYGVRCLKFGRGAASDLVAFTEHTKRVHVVDIRRFECHQILEIPDTAPMGQLQVEARLESTTVGASTSERPQRHRPRRRSAILVDVTRGQNSIPDLRGGRSPSPDSNPIQARVNRAIENIRARLSANLSEEVTGSQVENEEQRQITSTNSEPEVRMEDVSISLTDVGDGVLHISSHSGEEDEEDSEAIDPSALPARVVWRRTIDNRAPSPRSRITNIAPSRRHPSGSTIYIHRSAGAGQDQGYSSTPGSDTPTSTTRPPRRSHVRSASSTTTLAPEVQAEETGDIAGLTWSASGESLFIATTKSIVEWRISEFGRARFELGGGGDEWCEEGEEMAGQEMAWR